jgi:hypothetical protein
MKSVWSRLLPAALSTIFAVSLLASSAEAGTASGIVINRTTGKPVPNTDLDLLSPTQGMVILASIKSDADGRFTAANAAIGAGPVIIRVTYQGVSFNTFLPPGRPQIDVEVFDVAKDPKLITVSSHIVIFKPRGDKLLVGEEYVVQNNAQPPRAFFRTEGNFDFGIPPDAKLDQVSTTGATGMSVAQAAIDKGHGRNAIAYAFHPGETNIRLSYEIPYPDNAATVPLPATYPDVKLLVVVSPGMTATADGLNAAGEEQGMLVFTHAPLPAKSSLKINISGVDTGPQAADAGAAGGQPGAPDQGAMPQEGNSRTGGQDVQAVPGRLDVLKWPILIGFAALFALGAVLLSRKQVVVAPASFESDDEPVDATPATSKKPAIQLAQSSAVDGKIASAAAVAAVSAEVSRSLEALKDSIFRLELRRQAGTVSEEEYARERAQMEKTLRDLVRG